MLRDLTYFRFQVKSYNIINNVSIIFQVVSDLECFNYCKSIFHWSTGEPTFRNFKAANLKCPSWFLAKCWKQYYPQFLTNWAHSCSFKGQEQWMKFIKVNYNYHQHFYLDYNILQNQKYCLFHWNCIISFTLFSASNETPIMAKVLSLFTVRRQYLHSLFD